MSNVPEPLDFDELCDLFVRLGGTTPPAELHGLLTGQLCAGRNMSRDVWLRTARDFIDTESTISAQDSDLLFGVYQSTQAQLEDTEWGFYPLLPDDISEFSVRLEALSQWCQGFLAGFALVERTEALPELVSDAISDLAAIAQVGLPEEEDDAAEEDLMQLVEYVRLAALNIHVECSGASVSESSLVPQDQQFDPHQESGIFESTQESWSDNEMSSTSSSADEQPVGSVQNLFGKKNLH